MTRAQQQIVDFVAIELYSMPVAERGPYYVCVLAAYRDALRRDIPDVPYGFVMDNAISMTHAILARLRQLEATGTITVMGNA